MRILKKTTKKRFVSPYDSYLIFTYIIKKKLMLSNEIN